MMSGGLDHRVVYPAVCSLALPLTNVLELLCQPMKATFHNVLYTDTCHLPMTASGLLPIPYTALFWLGFACYALCVLVIVAATMTSPLYASWDWRDQLLNAVMQRREKVKAGSTLSQDQANFWRKMCEDIHSADKSLEEIWALHNSLLWGFCLLACAALIASGLFAHVAAGNQSFLFLDPAQAVYFAIGTFGWLVLGLFLASTTIEGLHDMALELGLDEIPETVEAICEHTRFLHLAQQKALGAKIFGKPFTTRMVLSEFVKIAGVLPAVLDAFRQAEVALLSKYNATIH